MEPQSQKGSIYTSLKSLPNQGLFSTLLKTFENINEAQEINSIKDNTLSSDPLSDLGVPLSS